MGELRAELFEELIELEYAQLGYDVVLSEKETAALVQRVCNQVEDMAYPPTSTASYREEMR